MLTRFQPRRRPGKILVMFVLVLTALFGMLGLSLDGGLMMASHRQVQNAADSAALAAAMDLMQGKDAATARATAIAWAQTYYGVTLAGDDVRIPPATGPHAGNGQFVEVVATRNYITIFAQAGGAGSSHPVMARAVAGFEPVSSGEGAIVLDPDAPTGLGFSGTNTRLKVKGTVVVNSRSGGWDQYGQPIPAGTTPSIPYAVRTSTSITSDPNQAYIQARAVQVAGGVDTPANIVDYDDPVNGPSPLYCGMPIGPDPLRTLPVPQPGNTPSISDWTTLQPAVKISTGQAVTLNPGIYEDIDISGGTATFNPGVYILSPTKNNQGLSISGGTVTGIGVMFYLAGSNYLNNGAGYWDALDGALDGPLPPNYGTVPNDPFGGSVHYARLKVAGSSGSVMLEGMAYNTDDPNDRILYFQRRRNTAGAELSGGGSGNMDVDVRGTIYAKWAQFSLSGGRTYDAQFIVGSLELKGGATMTINGTGINRGRANQVFLVE